MKLFNPIVSFFIVICLAGAASAQTIDPLPSWNDGLIKKNIIQFVETVTDKNNPDYVPPEDRIATIDNDGTLWVEQPIYTQVLFALERVQTLAPQHPEWQHQPPFQFVLNHELDKLDAESLEKIMAVTHSGMSVEAFKDLAKQWLAKAINPHFKRHYTELIYQPMLEVMQYLRQHHFRIYIVSGGGQDFMRAFAQSVYGVGPENVIGSTEKTDYVYKNNHPELIKRAQVLLIDNYAGKPENINLFIGKKPIIAFGNSTGDQQMLEWTQSNPRKHLMLLVHHDDKKREYAYGPNSKVGTFSDALMSEAIANQWQVISMKNDWKVIFPFQGRAKTDD